MNLILIRNLFFKIKIRLLGVRVGEFGAYLPLFTDKIGLEIGGPSFIFQSSHYLPVYKFAAKVDGVNFSGKTVWENQITEGETYQYAPGKQGRQYICEGNDLANIKDNSYDFLLSSHSLEHFANPLKAVSEWERVLKPGGLMLLILPDKRYTFDHRRNITTLDHLKEDYQNKTGEGDLTHVEEILELHDLSMDPGVVNKKYFKDRSLKNIENRCLHHHVFDIPLLNEIFQFFQIEPLYSATAPFHHMIALGKKR